MRANRLVVALLLAASAALQLGCSASRAPHDWLPYADEAQHDAWGGWIELQVSPDATLPHVMGELLAISEDSVFTLSGRTVSAHALGDVRHATLEGYDPRSQQVARMAIAGPVMSITTGLGLILIAPLWVITSTVSAAALSQDGKHELDPALPREKASSDAGHARQARASWKDLRLFARFPQGMPAGLDRSALHERTVVPHGKPRKPDPRSIAQ